MDERFNVSSTKTRARRLLKSTPSGPRIEILQKWTSVDLAGDLSGQLELAGDFIRLLGETIDDNVMHSSCVSLFGGPIRKEDLIDLCWRISANISWLRARRSLPPWIGLPRPMVAPLQVFRAKVGWSHANKPKIGTVLTFIVIDGESCPIKFDRWFSDRFLYRLAREMGIGNYRAKHRYAGNRNELVGMRMIARLTYSKYDSSAITFERYAVGQFETYNRKLMKLRSAPCPLGYQWTCDVCSLGVNECPVDEPISRACRPLSLNLRLCKVCSKETHHDDAECVRCRRRPPSVR